MSDLLHTLLACVLYAFTYGYWLAAEHLAILGSNLAHLAGLDEEVKICSIEPGWATLRFVRDHVLDWWHHAVYGEWMGASDVWRSCSPDN